MSRKGENIYKRKDGRWEARYLKKDALDGRPPYGYCYGKTYSEAKEKVTKAKMGLIERRPAVEQDGKKVFSYYCDEWLLLKRSKVKKSTLVKYENMLENHIKPQLGRQLAETFTEVQIERFSHELFHRKKLAPKTVKDILVVIHSVLDYAQKQNSSIKSPNIVYPKENIKEMRVLSYDEQQRFKNYLLNGMDTCKFGVFLALYTGLRIGELCALTWQDLSLKEHTLRVSRTMQRLKQPEDTQGRKTAIVIDRPKSGASVRIIPLNQDLAALCKIWEAQNPAAYILTGEKGRYMEPRTLQYRMAHYTRECGLSGVHFHTLRHSFATRCVEVGFELKSLSEILGHSNPRITLERYVHSSLRLKRENMEKLNGI